jgi:hypothetical protein
MDVQESYQQRGYHVFRDALPVESVDALANLVHGHIRYQQEPLLRHDVSFSTHRFAPGTALIENSLMDFHLPFQKSMQPVETVVASLIASPAMASCLRQLDGAAHYTIHQTIFFFIAQLTGLHFDGWGFDTAPRGYAHTLWIPLQDMTYRSGLPSVIPWERGKVVSEAELGLPSEGHSPEHYERYYNALTARVMGDRPELITCPVRRGDFMVWSSTTPHLSLPSFDRPVERMSLQVIVRPSHRPWGTFFNQPTEIWHARYINPSPDFSYLVKPDYEERLYA